MKKFLKSCFFTLPSLSVVFILYFVLTKYIKGKELTTNIEFLLFLICISAVFIVIGQIVYLIVHAIKNNELTSDKKVFWIIIIYMFNVFSIPCYSYKYLVKSKDYKLNAILYLIVSIILFFSTIFTYVTGFVNGYNDYTSSPIEETIQQYLVKDGILEISAHSGYVKKEVGEYDLYLRDEKTQLTLGIFTYDLNEYEHTTEEDIINLQVEYFKNTRDKFNIYKNKEIISLEDKKITTVEYSGKTEASDVCVYKFSTIVFEEKQDYIVFAIQVLLEEDYNKYSNELFEILKTATIK